MFFNFNLLSANMPALLGGLIETLRASGFILGTGMIIAALVCMARMSSAKPLQIIARAYVTIFRVTPELVLIFWAYFCLPIFFGPALSGFFAGCLSLALVAGAYLAEIFRAGFEAVPRGQIEAAKALGLQRYPTWRKIVVPQALRFIIPPFMNYMTTLVKNTTLLAAVAVSELAFQAFKLGAQTYRYFEFLTAIALLFSAVLVPLGLLSRAYEARLLRRYQK